MTNYLTFTKLKIKRFIGGVYYAKVEDTNYIQSIQEFWDLHVSPLTVNESPQRQIQSGETYVKLYRFHEYYDLLLATDKESVKFLKTYKEGKLWKHDYYWGVASKEIFF